MLLTYFKCLFLNFFTFRWCLSPSLHLLIGARCYWNCVLICHSRDFLAWAWPFFKRPVIRKAVQKLQWLTILLYILKYVGPKNNLPVISWNEYWRTRLGILSTHLQHGRTLKILKKFCKSGMGHFNLIKGSWTEWGL